MNRTENLRLKIEKLEKEVAAAGAKRKQLENELASAYSGDSDPAAAHQELSAHRQHVQDMIAALSSLDQQLRVGSITERRDLAEQIEREVEEKLLSAESELQKAATKLQKSVRFLDDDEAEQFARDVVDDGLARYRVSLYQWSSAQYDERMPEDMTGPAPRRDVSGKCFYETASGMGFFRDWRFNRKNRGGKLLVDGPHKLSVDMDAEEDKLREEAV